MNTADVGSDGSVDVTYKFDAIGRRVFRDNGTTATIYVQAGQQTIADYTASSAPSSPTYRYVYASYIDEPVLRFKPSGSESLYYHRNQQYSVVALTSSSAAIVERYAYSAYGVPTITNASGTLLPIGSVDNRYLYTGREWDQTLSLYHYRARMYDANLGRFTSRDPIGYEDGMGLYSFVKSNPCSLMDPLGNLTVQTDPLRHPLPLGGSPNSQNPGKDTSLTCAEFAENLDSESPNRFWPERAKNQFLRGAHIFCGNCNFQGESWNDGGQCRSCLDVNSTGTYERWSWLLVHELIHCSQYGCVSGGDGPRTGGPLPSPNPPANPNAPSIPEHCSACQTAEQNTYEIQCQHIYAGDPRKIRDCIESGICYSCRGRCKAVL